MSESTPSSVPGFRDRRVALVPLLLTLTVVTGVVDGVSYLALGHVFVANMTGNVVFLGFALAGAPGLSVPASLTAMACFLAGAVVGGRLAARFGAHRGRHLAISATATLILVAIADVLVLVTDGVSERPVRYAVTALLAAGMGVQNATSRRLAVPDLTTTVLTLTLTGLAADSLLAGGPGSRWSTRVPSITAMFGGALVGALLLRGVGVGAALGLAVALLAGCTAVVYRLSARTPAESWAPAPHGS